MSEFRDSQIEQEDSVVQTRRQQREGEYEKREDKGVYEAGTSWTY